MLMKFVWISLIKPDVSKTFSINFFGYDVNIILKHVMFKHATNNIRKLVSLAQVVEQLNQ